MPRLQFSWFVTWRMKMTWWKLRELDQNPTQQLLLYIPVKYYSWNPLDTIKLCLSLFNFSIYCTAIAESSAGKKSVWIALWARNVGVRLSSFDIFVVVKHNLVNTLTQARDVYSPRWPKILPHPKLWFPNILPRYPISGTSFTGRGSFLQGLSRIKSYHIFMSWFKTDRNTKIIYSTGVKIRKEYSSD